MAEDAIRLRDWILDNAGLEAQSMPIAIRVLWLMDRERWEAYEREHSPNTLEEGVELVLSYLEAAINRTAAQEESSRSCLFPSPPLAEAEQQELPLPPPPAEGEYLLVPPPPPWKDCFPLPPPPAEGEYLLVLPSPSWEDSLPLSPPPAEDEYLVVPPSPLWEDCLPLPLPPPEELQLSLAPPKDTCLAPPKDACLAPPKDACLTPPKVACLASPGVACCSASPGVACCSASQQEVLWLEPHQGELSAMKKGEEVRRPPTPAAVLLPEIMGEVRRPVPTAALSLPEVLWLESHKRELPALKKGGGQETTPQAAFPLPGLPQLKESAWELSAVTLTALLVAAWLLATLPPVNPLKSLFLAQDFERDFWDFKGGVAVEAMCAADKGVVIFCK
ncbi:UNVERIFIED_CONTAM: hypothetical protein FKN15_007973 [Acipenser sinensis]